MNCYLVAKVILSNQAKERLYETIDFLGDIEDMLYKTGVVEESAKHITETIQILKEMVHSGIIES